MAFANRTTSELIGASSHIGSHLKAIVANLPMLRREMKVYYAKLFPNLYTYASDALVSFP